MHFGASKNCNMLASLRAPAPRGTGRQPEDGSMRRLIGTLCWSALNVALLVHAAAAADITVFGAASLTNALQEIGKLYEARSGDALRFSFAASSTLARQIEAGANANLFVSADEEWMDYLAAKKLIVAASRVDLLGNRLVLVVPADRPDAIEIKPGFDLMAVLNDGKLATGDPAHVPIGKYAREALTALGVWPLAEARLVRTDTVREALVFVERKEVAAGIVYATDAAVAKRVRVAGTFPESSHRPIVYPMAIVAGQDTAASRRLHAFLRGEEAAAVFKKFGFSLK